MICLTSRLRRVTFFSSKYVARADRIQLQLGAESKASLRGGKPRARALATSSAGMAFFFSSALFRRSRRGLSCPGDTVPMLVWSRRSTTSSRSSLSLTTPMASKSSSVTMSLAIWILVSCSTIGFAAFDFSAPQGPISPFLTHRSVGSRPEAAHIVGTTGPEVRPHRSASRTPPL